MDVQASSQAPLNSLLLSVYDNGEENRSDTPATTYVESSLARYVNKPDQASAKSLDWEDDPTLGRIVRFVGDKGGRFCLFADITKEMAAAIFKELGDEINFPPGVRKINDFVIAKGGFGAFYIGKNEGTGEFVGVKVTFGKDAAVAETTVQERISSLRHIMPSLDKHLYDPGDLDGKKLFQSLPLAGLGNLFNLQKALRLLGSYEFEERIVFLLARSLLEALEDMHSLGYFHLDFKPDNVVLNLTGNPLVIDFGCTQQRDGVDFHTAMGDIEYFSPERHCAAFRNEPQESADCQGEKIDIWALGQTLFELIEGKPWNWVELQLKVKDGVSLKTLEGYITQNLYRFPRFQNPQPDSLHSFLLYLLTFSPRKRPTPVEARHHPWFQKMNALSADWEASTRNTAVETIQTLKRNVRKGLSPQDLPHPHFRYQPRADLQREIKEALHPKHDGKSSIVVVQGEGGSGKTSLATHLVYDIEIQERFGQRLWLRRGDSPEDLNEQLQFLAREWDLIPPEADYQEAKKAILRHLNEREKRGDKPWLLVIDNASSMEQLSSFFPERGGVILLTSRQSEWEGTLFSVPHFTLEQGKAYLSSLIGNTWGEEEKELLCQTFENLPIALHAVGSYIAYERLSAKDFYLVIQQIEQQRSSLSPLFAFWDLLLAKIQEKSPDARSFLNDLPFLAAEKIPPLFLSLEESPPQQPPLHRNPASRESLELPLLRYGLARKEPGGISVHRLLQEKLWSLLSLEQKRQRCEALCERLNNEIQKPEQQRLLFPHAQAFLRRSKEIDGLSPETDLKIVTLRQWVLSVEKEELRMTIYTGMVEKRALLLQQVPKDFMAIATAFHEDVDFWVKQVKDASKALSTFEAMCKALAETDSPEINSLLIASLVQIYEKEELSGSVLKILKSSPTSIGFRQQALTIVQAKYVEVELTKLELLKIKIQQARDGKTPPDFVNKKKIKGKWLHLEKAIQSRIEWEKRKEEIERDRARLREHTQVLRIRLDSARLEITPTDSKLPPLEQFAILEERLKSTTLSNPLSYPLPYLYQRVIELTTDDLNLPEKAYTTFQSMWTTFAGAHFPTEAGGLYTLVKAQQDLTHELYRLCYFTNCEEQLLNDFHQFNPPQENAVFSFLQQKLHRWIEFKNKNFITSQDDADLLEMNKARESFKKGERIRAEASVKRRIGEIEKIPTEKVEKFQAEFSSLLHADRKSHAIVFFFRHLLFVLEEANVTEKAYEAFVEMSRTLGLTPLPRDPLNAGYTLPEAEKELTEALYHICYLTQCEERLDKEWSDFLRSSLQEQPLIGFLHSKLQNWMKLKESDPTVISDEFKKIAALRASFKEQAIDKATGPEKLQLRRLQRKQVNEES